jgi:hypothetical protein
MLGPKWHSLRSLPFQGSKKSRFSGSTLSNISRNGFARIKIKSKSKRHIKNRYIGNFMYMSFCILCSVFSILHSLFCILYSVLYVVSFMFCCPNSHRPNGGGKGKREPPSPTHPYSSFHRTILALWTYDLCP